MEVSYSGAILAGLLFCFGLWQVFDQKEKLKELNKRKNKDRRSLRNFLIRQARRRLRTGILFGLTGLGMFAGLKIPAARFPFLCSLTWLCVIILLIWGIILTIIDLAALNIRYKEECQIGKAAEYGIEHLKEKEMKNNKE